LRRFLVPLLLPGIALAGCGGGTTIDHSKAESLLTGKAPTGGPTVVSAHCPSGVAAKEGNTFDCDVKLSDGTTGTWTVHIENNQGVVFTSGSDFAQGPPKSTGSEIGKTKLATASGGVRVRATLVGFTPVVHEPSPDPTQHISGVTLRLQNVGRSTYGDGTPADVTVLLLPSTIGADVAKNEKGPCGGSFYQTPLKLAPGASVSGCIPFEVGSGVTATQFKYTPKGEGAVSWFVR
jgi:hypothetical protein